MKKACMDAIIYHYPLLNYSLDIDKPLKEDYKQVGSKVVIDHNHAAPLSKPEMYCFPWMKDI